MSKSTSDRRAEILRCLIEGASVRATSRITGASKGTILRYLAEAGEACSEFMSCKMVNLPCKVLQLDEIWSFVGCKEKAKAKAVMKHPGDVWTFTSICSDTKLIPVWRVGDRSQATAVAFCDDLSHRLSERVQITSDGLESYKWAVGSAFADCDFAQLIKIYDKDETGRDVCVGARKKAVFGSPDIDLVSTSYVERSNLTIRMSNRRFTRLTNAFSKKTENHCHMLAIGFTHYNFSRRHMTLKCTPAQAAGICDHQMSIEEIVEMIDQYWQDKLNREFERAFAHKLTPTRTAPKTYAPTPKDQIPIPWYLNPESGGPDELL